MSNFETLCESITSYERKQLADDWSINFYSVWKDVTFAEIIADIERYGIGKNPYSLKNELSQRIVNYYIFANNGWEDVRSDRQKLRDLSASLKEMDRHFKLDLHEWNFGNRTADEIADEWDEQERWEQEEAERAELIDLCAKIAYNDGLCDSLEEAYDIAEMVC